MRKLHFTMTYVLSHDAMIYVKEVTTHWHGWGQGNLSAGQQSS